MTIKDVRGIEAQLRDIVAFAGGGKGASEFYVGTVTKINPATITIEYEACGSYYNNGYKTGNYNCNINRKEGMFVILESCQ